MAVGGETLVVDASVAVKWHLSDEEHSEEAARLLIDFAEGRLDLLAPEYIRYEVPAAITVATRGRQPRLTPKQGVEAIKEFLRLGLRTFGDDDIIVAAHSLARQYDCAFYDALYLSLAQRLDVPLIVADRRFFRRVSNLPLAVWIGDYPSR